MRAFQSITYLFGVVFFVMGQVALWVNSPAQANPFFLSSIICILMAMYLQAEQ